MVFLQRNCAHVLATLVLSDHTRMLGVTNIGDLDAAPPIPQIGVIAFDIDAPGGAIGVHIGQ